MTAPQKINIKKVPFTSTTKRFKLNIGKNKPGPGSYSAGNMIDSLDKKVWGRQGVFGSTEKRFVHIRDKIIVPGPGSYTNIINNEEVNTKLKFKTIGKESLKRGISSCFRSVVPRDYYNKNSEVPGPGMYSTGEGIGNYREYKAGTGNPLMAQVGDSRKNETAFYSKQERFMHNIERDPILGPSGPNPEKLPAPGHYETKDMNQLVNSKINPYSKASFGVVSNRFTGNLKQKFVPGPGQ